ncbi:MAG: radical SAM protein [Bdellovibrionota bacterium]
MLKLNEIFFSIQGESTQAGRPCIFIRLTGCKLRCTYCDTQYAYFEGSDVTIDDLIQRIKAYPCKLVELTGGEPMEQKEAPALLQRLLDEGYEVMLETDGVEDLAKVPAGVRIIMDVKTPGSKMANPKSEKNLAHLKPTDEVKFVICDEKDYLFAKDFVKKTDLENRFTVLFSPVMLGDNKDPAWLPEAILRDGLKVRYQMQLHKVLWGDKRGV